MTEAFRAFIRLRLSEAAAIINNPESTASQRALAGRVIQEWGVE